jgi:uncharacterized protein YjiS (DUF1127 family)
MNIRFHYARLRPKFFLLPLTEGFPQSAANRWRKTMTATMTCATTSRPVAPARESRSFLARLFALAAREIRIHRDMRVLASMDEAALHDIGLVRGSVEDAVRHGRLDGVAPAPSVSHPASLPHSLVEWR